MEKLGNVRLEILWQSPLLLVSIEYEWSPLDLDRLASSRRNCLAAHPRCEGRGCEGDPSDSSSFDILYLLELLVCLSTFSFASLQGVDGIALSLALGTISASMSSRVV